MTKEREVVITGIGTILPNCDDSETFWHQIKSGSSQLALIDDPSWPGNRVPAGCVGGFDSEKYLSEIPKKYRVSYSRLLQHYLASLFLARRDSALDQIKLPAERVGIYEGCSRGTIEYYDERIRLESELPAMEVYSRETLVNGINGQTVGVAAALLNVCGPTISMAGACSGGALATGQAFRDVREGLVDVAYATGHDSALVPALFAAYRKAGILNSGSDSTSFVVKPYDKERESTVVFGEGAVTLILEEAEKAKARGARILAKISAYSHGNEGRHPFRPGVNLERSLQLLNSLFASSGSSVGELDFLVGHGNGSPVSDMAEMDLREIFLGNRAHEVPWLSMKPIYGHALAASNSVNIAASALMLHHGRTVSTINMDNPLSDTLNTVRENSECTTGVAFSWGMGGTVAALLLERDPT